ncbi:MAG: hypothetical protein WAU32_00280 [Thermoanaerobaculia bacterium]
MNDSKGTLLPIRLAVILAALALLLGLALLFKETPYVFTAFMVLGPVLLAAAFVLLGWVIVQELRTKRVL